MHAPKQALDALTLKHLARELSAQLCGARIQKVQQPDRHAFVLSFWGGKNTNNGRGKLYIHLNPQAPCCFILQPGQENAFVTNTLEKPTGFCMLLRKYLVGARLVAIETLPGERVLNLTVDQETELGLRARTVLSVELMGKHTNMILYLEEEKTMLGAAHPVTEAMSRHREVAAGLPYIPPPIPEGKRLFEETGEEDFTRILSPVAPADYPDFLSRQFRGFGKQILKNALPETLQTPKELYALLADLVSGERLCPAILNEHQPQASFTLMSRNDTRGKRVYTSVQELVADYFGWQLAQAHYNALQHEILQVLQSLEKKRSNREAAIECTSPEEMALLQKTGDLLLTAISTGLGVTGPDRNHITVEDYESGKPVKITLDPALSLQNNARRYYHQAKKARIRLTMAREQAQKLGAERDYLAELSLLTQQASGPSDLVDLKEELVEAGLMKGRSETRKKSGKPDVKSMSGIMKLQSSDGLTLLVGKTGQANGALVGRLAAPKDIWLHVHQMPGSHVLIKTDHGPVPERTLGEAASLAVHFSAGRQSLNVPVTYTEARHVRKIPGSYPGHVTYQKEQTVIITPDPDWIRSVLAK